MNKKQQREHDRRYIADLAVKGAQKKNCGAMCGSCAFKLDSPANLEPHNVAAAISTLQSGQFNCHVEIGVDSGQPCKGFLNALQNFPDDGRVIRTYRPSNAYDCPSCKKTHYDKNDQLWKRCQKNVSGMTRKKCECGCKMGIIFFHNTIEVFNL